MNRMRGLGAFGALLSSLLLTACCSEQKPPPDNPPPTVKADDNVAPINKVDPDMRGESASDQVATRKDKHPNKRVVFLNDFGREDAKKIVAALKADPNFDADRFIPDYSADERITVECMYMGNNLRLSVLKAIEDLGITAHTREAELAKHLEVYRTP